MERIRGELASARSGQILAETSSEEVIFSLGIWGRIFLTGFWLQLVRSIREESI